MQPIFINIATAVLIIIVSIIIGIKLLRKKSPEAKAFGIFWFLVGITHIINTLLDILYFSGGLSHFQALLILYAALFFVLLLCIAAFVYLFLVIFYKRKKLLWLLIVPIALYGLFFLFLYLGGWDELFYGEWGVEARLPYTATSFFIFPTFAGLALALFIFLRELYRKYKNKHYNSNWLFSCLSIFIAAIFGGIDVIGLATDYYLILIRIMLLIAAIIGYFCYRTTKPLKTINQKLTPKAY